ncbi:HNH nuclease [Senna tora]|uniref:HNH nuclease n=1 Tax=Senna tora TaxID=362788 RepID=A0A834TDL1_9FABA|nr:HNH nuclease [Senna tora]
MYWTANAAENNMFLGQLNEKLFSLVGDFFGSDYLWKEDHIPSHKKRLEKILKKGSSLPIARSSVEVGTRFIVSSDQLRATSERPVNVVGWKRAICLEFMEKADVLEYYDQTVNSPSGSFYIPAVLRVPNLLQVVKRRIVKSNLCRRNILFRDSYTCQYCSSHENLTIDHVVPAALGGEWIWENLVTACAKCNSRKGHKTLEEAKMKLIKVPKAPKDYDILAIPLTNAALHMLTIRKGTPEEWRQYLSRSS